MARDDDETPLLRGLKAALVLAIFRSGSLLCFEALKLSYMARRSEVLPSVEMKLSVGPLFGALFLFLVSPVFKLLLDAENLNDCEGSALARSFYEKQKAAAKDDAAVSAYYQKQIDALPVCSPSRNAVRFIGVAALGAMGLYLLVKPRQRQPYAVLDKPSQPSVLGRAYSTLNFIASVVSLFLAAALILPAMKFAPSDKCEEISEKIRLFDASFLGDADRLVLETPAKRALLEQEAQQNRCLVGEAKSAIGFVVLFMMLWIVSSGSAPSAEGRPGAAEIPFFVIFAAGCSIAFGVGGNPDVLAALREVDFTQFLQTAADSLLFKT
jgi:hypothetical protein